MMLCTELNTLFHLSIYFVDIISRQTTWRLYSVQCLLLYVAFLVLREWVQMAITRNILQQYVWQSSKKYHSYIILWNYCILAAILDISWRTKWWLLPFLGTPINHSLWKIIKIALKFSVSTFLSNCSQTEPPLFPDDSHLGPTRMRFFLKILYSLLM